MSDLPIPERPYQAFLSHATADKRQVVDGIHAWCRGAGMQVWYDSENLHGMIYTEIGKAIAQSQAGIIVLSEASVTSGAVQQEYNLLLREKSKWPDFQIVPIRIDRCEVPDALRIVKRIELADTGFDERAAVSLVQMLHGHESRPETLNHRPVYLSRGSRANEVAKARKVVAAMHRFGVRIVRDAPRREMDLDRIRGLMRSCCGVIALVPHRGGKTSGFILDEVRLAIELKLPLWLIVDAGLSLHELVPQAASAASVEIADADLEREDALRAAGQDFVESLRAPAEPAYCFLGHVYRKERALTYRLAGQCVEAVAGMPCHIADDMYGDTMQPRIVDMIGAATYAIFDISDDNAEPALNTCIEAGIALGAGVPMFLIARGARRDPPFMFRNLQVSFYEDELELLGIVRRASLEHRRITE
jgi:hypothetical protein